MSSCLLVTFNRRAIQVQSTLEYDKHTTTTIALLQVIYAARGVFFIATRIAIYSETLLSNGRVASQNNVQRFAYMTWSIATILSTSIPEILGKGSTTLLIKTDILLTESNIFMS